MSLAAALLLMSALAGLSGCGRGSGDTGAEELAHQRELSAARSEAAQGARQATKIKDLERELHKVVHHQKEARTAATTAPTTDSSQSAAPPPAEVEAIGDWPGGSGFTAILASVATEEEARSIQSEATGRGLDAGVLFSSDYSSLRPGCWVVFSGVFSDADGAETRMAHARELGYSEAYPRFVSP
jgi:hypothetical protein